MWNRQAAAMTVEYMGHMVTAAEAEERMSLWQAHGEGEEAELHGASIEEKD